MNVISAVLLVVFAVIGIIAVVREISLRLFCYKDNCSVLLVTPLSGKNDDAEFVLRSACSKLRWNRRGCNCAICLDCEMDGETRRVCESICSRYGARLMSRSEFFELVGEKP